MIKKRIAVTIVAGVVLLLVAFLLGRASVRHFPNNGKLHSEIVIAQDQVVKIEQQLGLVSLSTDASADVGAAILSAIQELQKSAEYSSRCHEEVSALLEDAASLEQQLHTSTDTFSSSIDAELDRAIAQSAAYEDAMKRLQELENNNNKGR